MIICNTKLSEHAKRYAECRGIHHIGWSSPSDPDLQTMIEEKKLYPITYLKGLDTETQKKLTSAGIVLLKQLTAKNPVELGRETRIHKVTLKLVIKKARAILSARVRAS